NRQCVGVGTRLLQQRRLRGALEDACCRSHFSEVPVVRSGAARRLVRLLEPEAPPLGVPVQGPAREPERVHRAPLRSGSVLPALIVALILRRPAEGPGGGGALRAGLPRAADLRLSAQHWSPHARSVVIMTI